LVLLAAAPISQKRRSDMSLINDLIDGGSFREYSLFYSCRMTYYSLPIIFHIPQSTKSTSDRLDFSDTGITVYQRILNLKCLCPIYHVKVQGMFQCKLLSEKGLGLIENNGFMINVRALLITSLSLFPATHISLLRRKSATDPIE